ncbi:hypothetical protein [Kitasatospora sp. GAS1066B]|uniref:hypothetical protein n=1 Tax=Kitasatospora sp. GAS1066B TaxID=3156271 RepID=UPI003517D86B
MSADGAPQPQLPYRLPRVKREHQALRRADGSVQVGGDIYGIASPFDDPDGSLWRIIRLVDGTRSADRAAAPQLRAPAEDVAALLEALYEGRFLKDAAAQESAVLSAVANKGMVLLPWADSSPAFRFDERPAGVQQPVVPPRPRAIPMSRRSGTTM